MQSATPPLRTGRLTTRVASYMAVIITSILGVGQFIGLSSGVTFTLLEAFAILGGGLMWLTEIYFEGKNQGVSGRDYTITELLGTGLAVGAVVIGLSAMVGLFTGSQFIGLPSWAQGMFMLLLPVGLLIELHTE